MLREELLLTDEEIDIASALGRERYCKKCLETKSPTREHEIYEAGDKQVAQAQLEKALKDKRIRVEAENQELPRVAPVAEGGAIESITKRAQQDMLTPKDGCVWVKCETK